MQNTEGVRFQNISDVEKLIEQGVREVSALEFKSDVPLNDVAAKLKFLRDVTSMGNSGGGTIVFGLKSDDSSGVGIAQELSPISNPAIASIMENIVRDVVRPPLLWTLNEFEIGSGRVVVAEVLPSTLGPYMIQGYGDNGYYRRGEMRVVKMTEFEVNVAYSQTHRSAVHRDGQWQGHFLPMPTPPGQPWISIAALPFDPFIQIFEGKEINSYHIVHPPNIGNRLFGLPIHDSTVRHWADGLTVDDGLMGRPLTFAMRLHRDGAAGIIQQLEPIIHLGALARIVNAYLAYLADFWSNYPLRSPIELDVGIPDVSNIRSASAQMGMSPAGIINPPGVTVAKVAISEEVLPWELLRAPVRHGIVRRFIERVSYSFNWPYSGELFSYGRLFERDGIATELVLGPGLIVRSRGSGAQNVATIDEEGRVYGTSGDVKCFVIDGVVIDELGDSLAVVEMSDSVACPSEFLTDYAVDEQSAALGPWNGRTPNIGGPDVPIPTGRWSRKRLEESVA